MRVLKVLLLAVLVVSAAVFIPALSQKAYTADSSVSMLNKTNDLAMGKSQQESTTRGNDKNKTGDASSAGDMQSDTTTDAGTIRGAEDTAKDQAADADKKEKDGEKSTKKKKAAAEEGTTRGSSDMKSGASRSSTMDGSSTGDSSNKY